MENAHRSKDKMDLLSLNIELGGVEWIPCQPPRGLEYQAILTDPLFEDVRCYHLGSIEGTGVFFQGTVGQRNFCIHQEVVRQLYRIDNFFLKRNYYVSEKLHGKAQTSETMDNGQDAYHPNNYDPVRSPTEFLSSAGKQSPDRKGDKRKSQVPWSELDSDDAEDILSLDTTLSGLFSDARKQTNDVRFLDWKFIEQLSTMGQRRVPVADYISKHKSFSKQSFYLFDYVAMFVDFMDIFEDRGDFKIPLIQQRLEILDSMEGTSIGFIPMQHWENKGWSSSVKFLCQILPGEYQVSFLKVTLFFSIWRVATRAKLEKATMNEVMKSFLLGNESNKKDFTKIVRLNLSALANNKKIMLDTDYVDNYMSHVTVD